MYKEKEPAVKPALSGNLLFKTGEPFQTQFNNNLRHKPEKVKKKRRAPELNRTPIKARTVSETVSWTTTSYPPEASARGSCMMRPGHNSLLSST
jgi:hypothetical protein